jgi:hypothetical protein
MANNIQQISITKPESNEDQEKIIIALKAATQGIASAVELESITPIQIDCLLSTLIKQLQTTLG